MPVLPGLFGKLIIKAVSPESERKVKAIKKFEPASSAISKTIVDDFIAEQDRLVSFIRATENLDLRKIKVTSTIASFVTYSLLDCYTLLIQHEKRHFLQTRRVMESTGFPKQQLSVK
jgi:hypothetical protein